MVCVAKTPAVSSVPIRNVVLRPDSVAQASDTAQLDAKLNSGPVCPLPHRMEGTRPMTMGLTISRQPMEVRERYSVVLTTVMPCVRVLCAVPMPGFVVIPRRFVVLTAIQSLEDALAIRVPVRVQTIPKTCPT